jgi:hypothetical protein
VASHSTNRPSLGCYVENHWLGYNGPHLQRMEGEGGGGGACTQAHGPEITCKWRISLLQNCHINSVYEQFDRQRLLSIQVRFSKHDLNTYFENGLQKKYYRKQSAFLHANTERRVIRRSGPLFA